MRKGMARFWSKDPHPDNIHRPRAARRRSGSASACWAVANDCFGSDTAERRAKISVRFAAKLPKSRRSAHGFGH